MLNLVVRKETARLWQINLRLQGMYDCHRPIRMQLWKIFRKELVRRMNENTPVSFVADIRWKADSRTNGRTREQSVLILA